MIKKGFKKPNKVWREWPTAVYVSDKVTSQNSSLDIE